MTNLNVTLVYLDINSTNHCLPEDQSLLHFIGKHIYMKCIKIMNFKVIIKCFNAIYYKFSKIGLEINFTKLNMNYLNEHLYTYTNMKYIFK